MAVNSNPLSPAEIEKYFPAERPLPPDGVFEIGLVLGGTVSAGAYTAGVLDFLFEALDAWTAARDSGDPRAPSHSVLLSVVTGTSGGGVNGAIALRALKYAFPPVRRTTDALNRARNPFYGTWVGGVGIDDFLRTDDLDDDLRSILNGRRLERLADAAIGYRGDPRPAPRSWVADPLRLFAMVTNLRGLPYSIPFAGASGLRHGLVGHADFMRFALTGIGAPVGEPVRPDEFELSHAAPANWPVLRGSALATSAFPVAFEARVLSRPVEQYRYRVAAVPGDSRTPGEVRALSLDWTELQDGAGNVPPDYEFLCVDGGAMNNEPFDVARIALAGETGRNPRAGREAKRAIILVDPFSDPETLGPTADTSLFGLAGALMNSWIYNSRFKPIDLALAQDPDIYSRFLIAPRGPDPDPHGGGADVSGVHAIASGGLGGFQGFLHPDFVRYDYFLGRRNCQRLLQKYFAVPADNPLVAGRWTPDQLALHRAVNDAGVTVYPVVPLLGACAQEETLETWPRGRFDIDDIDGALGERLKRIFELLSSQVAPSNPILHLLYTGYVGLGVAGIEGRLKGLVEEKIRESLAASFL
jgi:patatin-like phospholipase